MPGAANDEDILARVIERTSSAASTSGNAGKSDREVFRCKLCGHSEHARYAINRHVRHNHADQLRPLEAAVRPLQYFRLGREQTRLKTSSFAGVEMNIATLSSPAAVSENSELRRFVEFETLSNIKNKSIQSEKLFVCLLCKEVGGRTQAYESSEWSHIEAHLRLKHPAAVKRPSVKPAPLSAKKTVIAPPVKPDAVDEVKAPAAPPSLASPTRIRQLNSNLITFVPAPENINDAGERLTVDFPSKVPTEPLHDKDTHTPPKDLPSIFQAPDHTNVIASAATNKVAETKVLQVDSRQKREEGPRISPTSSPIGEAFVEPKTKTASRDAYEYTSDTEEAASGPSMTSPCEAPEGGSTSATRTKIMKRDKFSTGRGFKNHRETKADEKKHYFAPVPSPISTFPRRTLAAQVFSMSIETCKNDIPREAEAKTNVPKNEKQTFEDETSQITWLTVKEASKMGNDVQKTVADQTEAPVDEMTENITKEHSSNEKLDGGISWCSVNPQSRAAEEKKGDALSSGTASAAVGETLQTSLEKSADCNSENHGEYFPDMPMDTAKDGKEANASDTDLYGCHSAQPIDADQVEYLKLCSQMSGIALKDFYAQLTAENFAQAEKDVILFRISLGFNSAFEWPEDKA